MTPSSYKILIAFFGGCLFGYCLFSSHISHSMRLKDPAIFSRRHQEVAVTSAPPLAADPAFSLKISPDRRFIIVLAAFRSGSSFLGDLFDNNPAMYYMSEPFHNIHIEKLRERGQLIGARSHHTESDLRMLYIQQMLHNCTAYLTPFFEKYDKCGTPEEHLVRFNSTKCDIAAMMRQPPGYPQQQICMYRQYHVIKVIRLADLKDIMKIHQIKRADIQVIHLLRHPVPLMMSRRTGGKYFIYDNRISLDNNGDDTSRRTKLALEAYNYCYNHIRAMEFVDENPWLKERYMRVTHHEMSAHPLETAQKIYNFIGAELTENMESYIQNITGATSDGFLKARERALNNAKGSLSLNVFKNSTDIITRWKSFQRTSLRYQHVVSIESLCKNLYDPLRDEFSVDGVSTGRLLDIHGALDDYYDISF